MSDTDDLPPGHPAGSDDTVTGGEVLSGRGKGMGGAVPPVTPEDPSGTMPDDIDADDMDEVPPPGDG